MIYFIRHGETHANIDQIFSGPDEQLTNKGKLQAKLAGEKIQSDGIIFDRIISSTYERAVDTAKIIAQVIGFNESDIQYDHRLVEWNAGDLIGHKEAGVSFEQVMATDNIETPEALYRRVSTALREIELLPGNTLIVGHAGAGCMIQVIKKKLDINDFYSLEPYANCQLILLEQ